MLTHLYEFVGVVSGKLHSIVPWYPQFRWPADVFGAVNMLLIAMLLGSWPFVERRRHWALILATVAGVVETINGINHIAAVFSFPQIRPRSGDRAFSFGPWTTCASRTETFAVHSLKSCRESAAPAH